MIRGVLVIAVALGVVTAPSAAGATSTFISGFAANAVRDTYRSLASEQAVPAVAAPPSNVSVDVQETPESVSIEFRGLRRRSVSSESRRMVTLSRPPGSRVPSDLDGSKTVGPAQTSAVLNAMDFVEQHPSPLDTIRKDMADGNYILHIGEVGTPYIYIGMSYPAIGDPRTSIGCNPRRQFRYNPSNNTVFELKPTCP